MNNTIIRYTHSPKGDVDFVRGRQGRIKGIHFYGDEIELIMMVQ